MRMRNYFKGQICRFYKMFYHQSFEDWGRISSDALLWSAFSICKIYLIVTMQWINHFFACMCIFPIDHLLGVIFGCIHLNNLTNLSTVGAILVSSRIPWSWCNTWILLAVLELILNTFYSHDDIEQLNLGGNTRWNTRANTRVRIHDDIEQLDIHGNT